MDLGQEGREARALHRLARGQTEAAIAPAVEGAEEADDGGTASRVPGQLDRALDRFRARVRQEHALLTWPGRELGEPLAQRREALVVEVRATDMKEARRGVLDRLHDFGMPVARGRHRDARHEIEEAIAVHVLDHGALAARHGERILLGVRRRREAVLASDDRAGLWPRRRDDDAGIIAGGRGRHRSIPVMSEPPALRSSDRALW